MVSSESQTFVGLLLLFLVTVEAGGFYMVKLSRAGAEATPFQVGFARAGHAHAGVLLILAVVVQPYVDAAGLDGVLGWIARTGVAVSALLLPGGFFFSSMGRGVTSPNRWVVLIPLGAAWLALSLVVLALGLLV